MKLTELYAMPVEKIGAQNRGYVLGAVAGDGKLNYLICCNEDENEYVVTTDSIISLDEKIVYSEEERRRPKNRTLRLGALCCDERGKALGFIEEIFFKNFTLKSAQIGGKRYACDRLVFGDVIIVKDRKKGDINAGFAARDMFIDAVCS